MAGHVRTALRQWIGARSHELPGYRARTVALVSLTPEDEARWATLAEHPLEPNPFFTPAYLATARGRMEGADDILLVVVERHDEWVAVLPLAVEKKFRGLPLRYASTAGGKFLGNFPALCAPLVHRAHARGGLASLVDHLASRRSRLPGMVELTLLPLDSPLLEVLETVCRDRGIPLREDSRFSRPYARSDDPHPAPDHLSSARRKQLRRHRKALEREIGATLEFIDHGSDPDAFARLLDLEANGWRGREGSAFRSRPQRLAWYTEVERSFRGRARVGELRADGVTLYLSYVLLSGTTAFGVVDAYNEDHAKFSPGSIGRVLEQQSLLPSADVDALDPCIHPARYPEASRYFPGERDLVSMLMAPRGVAIWLLRLAPAARALRDVVRSLRKRPRAHEGGTGG